MRPFQRLARPTGASQRLLTQGLSLVLLLVGLFAAGSPGEPWSPRDGEVDRLLAKSILATRGVTLRGRLLELVPTGDNSMLRTVRQVARTSDGKSLTKCVEPSPQAGCVTLDDGQWMRSYDPHAKLLTIARSVQPARNASDVARLIRRLKSSYHVRLLGPETVAGRKSQVLAFEPVDPFGRGLRIAIDSETGVTLSRTVSDRKGGTLCVSHFEEISYPRSIPASEVTLTVPHGTQTMRVTLSPRFQSIAQLRRAAGFNVCPPLAMPPGYALESCEMALLNGARTACLHYCDGASSINIFQFTSADRSPPGQRTVIVRQQGQDTAAITFNNGLTIVVTGDRDREGLLAVANTMWDALEIARKGTGHPEPIHGVPVGRR